MTSKPAFRGLVNAACRWQGRGAGSENGTPASRHHPQQATPKNPPKRGTPTPKDRDEPIGCSASEHKSLLELSMLLRYGRRCLKGLAKVSGPIAELHREPIGALLADDLLGPAIEPHIMMSQPFGKPSE